MKIEEFVFLADSANFMIDKRKKAEEALQLKDLVFDASIAANSIADNNGFITHVNNAFLKMWGYKTKEQAIGNSVADFFVNVSFVQIVR